MRFTWDRVKSRRNFAKHKVSFELAEFVFRDPLALSIPDPCEHEERWQTMGLVNGVVVILVVHTVAQDGDEEVVRIISARRATRCEREKYEESY